MAQNRAEVSTSGSGGAGLLSADSQMESDPFDRRCRRLIVFSIGARNESHGSALPSNIDDYMAIFAASSTAMRLGLTYAGHLPYSSDRAGPVALDWNPSYMPKEELVDRILHDMRYVIKVQKELGNDPIHVLLVSGHGGNNFLSEYTKYLTEKLGVPFHYFPPFPGSPSVYSEKFRRRLVITHADDGEHSVGLYLGLLDERKLLEINEVAREDPIQALRRNPAIMGLGFYVLPEIGGSRYENLRRRHPELVARAREFVEKDREIVADYEVGRKLMDDWIGKNVDEVKKLVP
ncbi:MAG TPA: hypothetical protein VFF30_16975 [Nitrososphaerales archaeon]|nr:hypothetical protein [Nitrososphaerales archaeon]